ncbi:MAG: phosphodiester glycosidase family protein [Parachlamydiaceae bacterium]|nr:phosphodiester glycosidase family protein [Parachlamydiaceae bacterium]
MLNNILWKMGVTFLLIVSVPFEADAFSYEYFPYGYFTSIHVLTVDPKEHVIVPVKAFGDNIGRETVVNLSNHYKAVAAVNGGFWKTNGSPAGILKINHKWYGTPIKPRGAIGWSSLNHQKVIIDKILTNYHLNDFPSEDEIEVIPKSDPPYTTPEDWKGLEHIVGGAPVLVSSGNLIQDYSSEQTLQSFLINKHPRTAVGIKRTGEWVFVVVDGSFYGFLGGMTIKELAGFMHKLDCTDALNLDGGGSSTMVVEGIVINEPSGKIKGIGKRVEAVSDAILILPK